MNIDMALESDGGRVSSLNSSPDKLKRGRVGRETVRWKDFEIWSEHVVTRAHFLK